MQRKQIYILLMIITILHSCMKDDELWEPVDQGHHTYGEGVFIVNEGNFTYNNSSLSYYDIAAGKVYNDVFFNKNGLPLGDVALSMNIKDSLGYIIINNSGKINIININSFEYTGKISGLTSPRYIHFINDSKAYITDLYARSVSIIDVVNLSIAGSINVNNNSSQFYQHPTEQMVQYGRFVFTNCWSYDNKILIIDSRSDMLVDSIEVLIQPKSMVIDRFGKIWILSDGGFEGSPFGYEAPGLIRVDAETRLVEKIWRFEKGDFPNALSTNGSRDTLFFINRHVYRHPVYSESDPVLFIESPYDLNLGGFNGLGIDPNTSEIYVADAIDYVQPGLVYRFSAAGMAVDTFRVGIVPVSFCFK